MRELFAKTKRILGFIGIPFSAEESVESRSVETQAGGAVVFSCLVVPILQIQLFAYKVTPNFLFLILILVVAILVKKSEEL